MKFSLPLMKNVLVPVAKSVLIPLRLIEAADEGIHRNVLGSETSGSGATALIISNNEMKDTMKVVTSLEDSGLLIKGVQTIETETGQKGGFLGILVGTLSSILFGNVLAGRGMIGASDRVTRAGQDF